MLDFCEEALRCGSRGLAGVARDCDEDAAQDPSRATQPLGNVARAVVHAMSSTEGVAPQPCPDIVLAGCLVAVVFGGAKRALGFFRKAELVPLFSLCGQGRCALFARLKPAPPLPEAGVDVYLRYAAGTAHLEAGRRRFGHEEAGPSLEELDEDERDNRMKKECRWARRRARAAEKHRAVVGPTRDECASRAEPRTERRRALQAHEIKPHVREISKGLDAQWWVSFSHRR